MMFPISVGATLHVPSGGATPPSSETVLDHIERALHEYDAEILERGEGFLTFRVQIDERLARTIGLRVGGWGRWWPFDFVSSGTLSVAVAPDRMTLHVELRPSRFPVILISAIALVGGVLTPLDGALARTLCGALLWVALGIMCNVLGVWQFNSWLTSVTQEALES